jgi:PKD repeat protein
MGQRLSSLDAGYLTGDLSVYPEAIDNTTTLYEATNNAETTLKQALSFNGKKIVVNDASKFPTSGIIRVGPPPGKPGLAEFIYYERRTDTTFFTLCRGFLETRQNKWDQGSYVSASVFSEHQNAKKDAVLNIEANLGERDNPATGSLNQILDSLEQKWLAPRPLFRAFPLIGPPALTVRFQNFSLDHAIRFFWEFGDGGTSTEKSPTHTYLAEGFYTVSLNMITEPGGTGIVTKNNYIEVSNDAFEPFFYVLPQDGTPKALSVETAAAQGKDPTVFDFVDQTDGDVIQRFWVFDDSTSEQQDDPNIHFTTHVYEKPGEYEPSLLNVFASQEKKRAFLREKIIVF